MSDNKKNQREKKEKAAQDNGSAEDDSEMDMDESGKERYE